MKVECPHGCREPGATFEGHYCLDDGGVTQEPGEGDMLCCYRCGGWGIIVNGIAIPYIPTREQLTTAITQMSVARKHMIREFRRRGMH